jgi:probable DNA repair protein
MTDTTVDHESLFQQLSSGLTLVTGNSRLARVLTGQYGQWRIARGDRQWQSPAILPWDGWINNLWEAASLQDIEGCGRAVPGSRQLVSLWERVLRDDPRARQLLRPESMAGRLRDTRSLVIQWRLDLHHPAWSGDENENHSAFYHWNQAFEALCRRNNWLPPEDRTDYLCRAVRAGTFEVASPVALLGFDEFNPGQIELLDALNETGHSVRPLVMTTADSSAKLWKSHSGKDELERMARWVRYWFEQEPGSRIAVVVPDLQARRKEIERHLDEILTPGQSLCKDTVRPWNISMGVPLARVPMIESAFDTLRLLNNRIDIQDAGRVLRSPWISGGDSERNSRALLEKCLRDNYPRQLKLAEIRYRAGELRKYDSNHQELPPDQYEARVWNSPVLLTLIDKLTRFQKETQGSRAPSAWAEALDSLLSRLGWPLGSDAGTTAGALEQSENWQAFQAWQEGLRELASLDATVPTLSRTEAIQQLQQVCRERIFQPRTPPATIQVLGMYEASGLRFDHLWVLGLHNDNWPPAAQPNPFIPGVLQQKAQMPQSSPARELEVARLVTGRLLETADDCVFSYPGQLDGEDVLPSPMLEGARIQPVDDVPGWQGDSWKQTVNQSDLPETATLLMPGPLLHGTARGGSSILKHQALCPFRAFASNRLGADGLETPVDGISPSLHGSLVHRVLENFWQETLSHETLISLDETSLATRIEKHVDHVINEERALNNRPQFKAVEGARLARLAAACLDLEKVRDPFEVIGFEKEILHEIEGQSIRLVIDRIDRLPGGEEVIIDYKTGKVDPARWFGSRPDDPQLPLYSTSAETIPAAIVFAVIRDDECLYRGVVNRDGIFPGLPPKPGKYTDQVIEAGRDMPLTIVNWRQILHRLMADFLAGEAAIDPKDGRNTCKNSFCELQALCRISELEQFQKMKNRQAGA